MEATRKGIVNYAAMYSDRADGLMQKRRSSSVLLMELCLFCIKQSIFSLVELNEALQHYLKDTDQCKHT